MRLWRRVPDGPPVRGVTCTRDCDTRWDREPRHSEECMRRGREAVERIRVSQEEYARDMDAYLNYRERMRDELEGSGG